MSHIDIPSLNDNRNYDYSQFPDDERKEYAVIVDFVQPNSRVIDLGCGNGTLLARLKKEKNIAEQGLEISQSGIDICRQRGLNVQFGKIDDPLPFADNQFDYAICNVTVQMVMYPEILLKEMKRISRYQIISFPNFAFWKNRIDLLFEGRMPRPMLFGYSWYSTGHIHQLSFRDFKGLLTDIQGFQIVHQWTDQTNSSFRNYFNKLSPNLFQLLAIFLLKKNEFDKKNPIA